MSARPGTGGTIGTTGAVETPKQPELAETVPSSETDGKLAAGHRLGRFAISHLLGAGGMGQVYAARDPELDRLVAIKLLRPELSIRADARLRREARVMARLSHPNLVTVHEVGVHQGQLFVAMELIDGQTLRHWARGKSWREIVRVYIAAGRGLAAAHEAGIVHRDFKPDNVLVGAFGRVAVSDFGLARTEEDDLPSDAAGSADERLTQAGALLGTLRYMAPEQLERRIADTRSDQFAFCVSLWEALDDHPFDNLDTASDTPNSADARRDAMGAGLSRRRLRGVPRQISRALVRGLAIDPADRWPAMAALLGELESAVARRGKLVIGGSMFGLIGVAITTTWLLREPQRDPCAHITDALKKIWESADKEKDRLEAAFAATGRVDAAATATRVAGLLDSRAGEWAKMRFETCVAAKVEGDERAELHERQVRCLDGKLHELESLTTTLRMTPSADVVDRAVRVTTNLAPIADCGNVAQLLTLPPPPSAPLIEARIDRLDAKIHKFAAREVLAGDGTDAELDALAAEAAELRWDPLIAQVAYIGGVHAYRRGDEPVAEARFRQAALVAARAHEDNLVAKASAYAVEVMIDSDKAREALEVAKSAELACARANDPPALKADVLASLGDVYTKLDRFEDSDRSYEQAKKLLEASDTNPLDLAMLMNNWANNLYERSDYARSVPLSNRAIVLLRKLLGEHHPDLARALNGNGNAQLAAHHFDLAMQRFQEALAIKVSLFGETDATVAMTHNNIGNVYTQTGKYDLAAAEYQRALDLWLAKLGPAHANVQMARYNLATNLRRQGKPREALTLFEDVLARRQAADPAVPSKVANTLDSMASCYDDLGDRTKAIEFATRAFTIRDTVLGPDTDDTGESVSHLAQLWAAAGDCTKARPYAERALAIGKKQPVATGGPLIALAACALRDGKRADAIADYREALGNLPENPLERGAARLALADLVWPTDHAGARELATAALAELGPKADLAKKWLASHP